MEKFKSFKVDMSDNSIITTENIIHIGEIIALCALKTRIKKTGINFDGLYQGLVHDIYRKSNSIEPFTDGYDVANTAIAFLCQHIGQRLGDTISDRYGKPATVRQCCYRYVDTYLYYQYVTPIESWVSLDDESVREPSVDFEIYTASEDEYTVVDDKISAMKLKKNENNVLSCYMAGLGHIETAKTLNLDRTTVWRCRQKVKTKYISKFC